MKTVFLQPLETFPMLPISSNLVSPRWSCLFSSHIILISSSNRQGPLSGAVSVREYKRMFWLATVKRFGRSYHLISSYPTSKIKSVVCVLRWPSYFFVSKTYQISMQLNGKQHDSTFVGKMGSEWSTYAHGLKTIVKCWGNFKSSCSYISLICLTFLLFCLLLSWIQQFNMVSSLFYLTLVFHLYANQYLFPKGKHTSKSGHFLLN